MTFGLIGLLFNLHFGFLIGLGISLFIFILFSFFGEKFILIFAKARYVTDDEALINQVKNFCCHCEIPEVKVYWSSTFVNNLYYTNSYFGKPSLIIGKEVYDTFTRNELNSLIYASLLKLKTNEAKHRTIASLIFVILYSPVYLLRLQLGQGNIANALSIFLYPAYYLESKIYDESNEILLFDNEVAELEGLRKDYLSALFKISHLPACRENSAGALVMSGLTHVKNQASEVVNDLFISRVSIKDRVKALK